MENAFDLLVKTIERLVEENEVETAIDALLELEKRAGGDFRQEVVLHSGNYLDARKMFKTNLISFDEYSRKASLTRHALLDLIKSIKNSIKSGEIKPGKALLFGTPPLPDLERTLDSKSPVAIYKFIEEATAFIESIRTTAAIQPDAAGKYKGNPAYGFLAYDGGNQNFRVETVSFISINTDLTEYTCGLSAVPAGARLVDKDWKQIAWQKEATTAKPFLANTVVTLDKKDGKAPAAPPTNAIPQFVFLSDESDKPLIDRLNNHLFALRRAKKLEVYNVHRAKAGEDVEEAARKALETADYLICFVSPNLFNDQAPWFEMTLDFLDSGRSVIPVMLQKVDISGTGLEKLKALPPGKNSISEYGNPDAAYAAVAKEIGRLVG